jgi:hypothetical protein
MIVSLGAVGTAWAYLKNAATMIRKNILLPNALTKKLLPGKQVKTNAGGVFSINGLIILSFFIGLHGINTEINDGRGHAIKKQNP